MFDPARKIESVNRINSLFGPVASLNKGKLKLSVPDVLVEAYNKKAGESNVVSIYDVDIDLSAETTTAVFSDGDLYLGNSIVENDGIHLSVVSTNILLPGIGIGKEVYKTIGLKALDVGLVFRSDLFRRMNNASTNLWESLLRDGYAIKGDDRYYFVESYPAAPDEVDVSIEDLPPPSDKILNICNA